MRSTPLYLLAAWSATTPGVASTGIKISGQSDFNMSLLVPRQQQGSGARANLQAFSGALGGVPAPAIANSGNPERPFEVDGDTFRDYKTAANRACDNQKNDCADLANNGSGAFRVSDCDDQRRQCKSTAESATVQEFAPPAPPVLVGSNAEFDFFCDV